MKKSKAKKLFPPQEIDQKSIDRPTHLHIRLCHHCLHLNESEADILKCANCQKYLTIEPLLQQRLGQMDMEDIEEAFGEGEAEMDESSEDTGSVVKRANGLYGLSVIW